MKFTQTVIPGAYIVDAEPQTDARGQFARIFCRDEFHRHGLEGQFVQASLSFNHKRGTLRGMHYQAMPHAEIKLVRCTAGIIHDVIVDLRPDSPAFKRWFSLELSSSNRRALYIPKGVAHGFMTLEDGSEVLYQMTEPYRPESARGVRWDDPAFAIHWPATSDLIISRQDREFPDFGS